jgi:hypothetical protein
VATDSAMIDDASVYTSTGTSTPAAAAAAGTVT